MIKDMKNQNNQDKALLNKVIEDVTNTKAVFIKPKALMQQSIENDAQYLLALGDFIHKGQHERLKLMNAKKEFEASRLQVEILDAVGKYQANEGIVNEKKLHYDNVFLPMYDAQLKECEENFSGMLNQCKELVSNMEDSDNKIIGYLKKEIKVYEDYHDKEIEFQNHTYKILKRLYNKFQEEQSLAK
jgi:hypothetical protein